MLTRPWEKQCCLKTLEPTNQGHKSLIKCINFLIFRAHVGNKIQPQHANRYQAREVSMVYTLTGSLDTSARNILHKC